MCIRDSPYAVAKYVRVSPYKVRTVLALIRGKSYQEAKAILDYSTNGSALAVKKVLMSAAANAEDVYKRQASTKRRAVKTYSSFTAACGAIIVQNAERRIPWQRSSRRTACLSARAGEW